MNSTGIIGFDELIRNYRKVNKLSQSGFGNLINKNQVTVSNYETKIHFPKHPEELKAIAQLLNQPVSYIIDSIEYARSGTIEKHEPLIINLDSDINELQKKYKFVFNGEDVTKEDIEKIIYLIRFERFIQEQDTEVE